MFSKPKFQFSSPRSFPGRREHGWGRTVSLRLHLFVSDVNQGNEYFECKKIGSRFSCVAPGMKRFSLDLLRAVKKYAV